ncbi:hypothetical protein [Cellulomonas sp. HZM]|uniref:hypothetical protein n=1 Tax=Cellulomonas sp. HZM TaxID=1454010 RepID=UPI000558C2EC|nr:hypothetical protein [Cellulomonas sp. HZM]
MPVDQVVYSRHDVVLPGLVEHAWVVRHDEPSREVLLPDGRGLLQLVVGPTGTLARVPDGSTRPDGTGVRGIMRHAAVRVQPAGTVRLGLQLAPQALAATGASDLLVDRWADPEAIVGTAALAEAARLLEGGDGLGAARLLTDELARLVVHDEDLDRFAHVLHVADRERGLVAAADLARAAEVTVSDLFRWSLRYLGVEPAQYLAAVRFSGFVREAVGPGVVVPEAVLRAVRWYADAGHAPREVERTVGCAPAELRRIEESLAAALA